MSFFKKLFGIRNSKETSNTEVIGFVYATIVFSHGWNDPSEIMSNQTSIILDVVKTVEEIESKLNYWNKLYYNQIPQHYSLDEEQLGLISKLINVPKEKYRELYDYWPKSINQKDYKELYDRLKLNFVQYKPIKKENKGKYVIIINEKFWSIKTHNSVLLVDIINTYERYFKDFELIHDSLETAKNYGIIIMDRLCNQRGPDNSYYYERAIKKQIKGFQKLPIFNFNSLKHKEEEIRNEYERIISEKNVELKLMKSTLYQMDNKPFEIVKIKDDD